MSQLPIAEDQFSALHQAAYQLSSCTDQIFQQIDQERALTKIIDKIRSCLEVESIFQTTATEVRQLLNADRVGIFRFTPGTGWDEGEFVSEDVAADFSSALAAKVRDHCFGTQFAQHYIKGRVQAVSDIYDANLSDCHIQILAQFQVRANLIVPVLKGDDLWGLLCIHQCKAPRRWQLPEIEFVKKIANYFAIALQQTEQLEQIQHQAIKLAKGKLQEDALIRQKALAKITNRIRQSLDFKTICQTAVDQVRTLLNVDRVSIFRFNPDWSGDFIFESVGEGWPPLIGVLPCLEDTHLMETQGGRYAQNETFAVADVYQSGHTDCHIQLLEQFQAKAYAVAPIFEGDRLWGLLAAYQNSGPRVWDDPEVELLAQICEQLSIALLQSSEKENAVNRQKALVKIVNKIRQSNDFDLICQTVTEEARYLLKGDRVAIFRFNADWSGEFIFESKGEECTPLVGALPCIEDTHLMETQGGRYAANETFAVSDIYEAGHTDCHVELLEQFDARAYAIAPIFEGDRLWGLLACFQNTGKRQWELDQIELLAQIGEQLGIALQQANTMNQLRTQSIELSEALEQLKQSQAELIQREKMAALGQLIAGVAHEINNPLGAIQAAATNIHVSLDEAIRELPTLHKRLSSPEQDTFFALIQHAIQSPTLLPSPETRAIRRKLSTVLKEFDVSDTRYLAELLMDMGVKDDPTEFLPLLQSPQNEWAIRCAYNLTRGFINNQTIINAVERSTKIVFALKSYARIEQSDQKQLFDARQGLDNTLEIYYNQIKRNITLLKEYREIPKIWGYPDDIIQVWTNLIHNSIQAMEDGGRLTISVYPKHDGIEACIEDTGTGIPSEIKDQIFDAFFTTKPAGKGSGLGLHICRKIIDKHDGHMTVDSHPGQTKFRVWLPISELQSAGEQ